MDDLGIGGLCFHETKNVFPFLQLIKGLNTCQPGFKVDFGHKCHHSLRIAVTPNQIPRQIQEQAL